MITKKQAKQLRTLITKFETLAREDAFKGSQRPGDAKIIEQDYAQAKTKLQLYIQSLIGG